ncbi:443_t:CDS:2 [Ambispora leptoticha]|uniref:443_t:CDS:1 n=1 Tax=Ambispora leptoticha TaxID=144679 RepID=A0A9N9GCS9_9GLOM|nr:443_t:CDS:2 [Ambispora leptoticha]
MFGVTAVIGRRTNWNQVVSCSGERIEFLKRLYLDHVVGCDRLENTIFGSRLDVRKLGRMDVRTLQSQGLM